MTYTYKCHNIDCENYNINFTVEKSINDDSEVKCSKCNCIAKRVFVTPFVKVNCDGFCGKIG